MGKIGLILSAAWNRLTMNENVTAKVVYSIQRQWPKVQRNDPCPCGSRLKYKQCCMGKKKLSFKEHKAWRRNLMLAK